MKISAVGRAWTAHSEGCRLTAYPDNGAYSIGYGHRGVPAGTTWTQEQAEEALDDDLCGAAYALGLHARVPLSQGQFDALCDFVFNEGSLRLAESTLLRVLNSGDYARVPDELRRWVIAEGEVSAGLKARREGEVVLWNGGDPLAATNEV